MTSEERSFIKQALIVTVVFLTLVFGGRVIYQSVLGETGRELQARSFTFIDADGTKTNFYWSSNQIQMKEGK